MRLRTILAAVVTPAALLLAGCAPTGPTVATFQVAGDQTYKIELATPELIQHVKDLMAGSEEGRPLRLGGENSPFFSSLMSSPPFNDIPSPNVSILFVYRRDIMPQYVL